ncbi:MAG: DinB family protein [Chitinophaga sp.]|uniref:DinB family protein n=1 Tax=Chitinophaga sp. TaxID=1869181 RepID=UPI001B09BE4B|nr:DinB family protein [Chitinophaga sp.]MBO9732809.1 DinB family protein [Chitinophaga sp.]
MKTALLHDIDHTGNTLLRLLSSLSTEQLNTLPFEGSWTAAQVAEHIWKAGDCSLLYGPAQPTDRMPDEKVDAIKAMFLNFGIKMQSPEMIRPGNDPLTKDEVLQNIHQAWEKLTNAANTLDLKDECMAFEVPGFGPFTRYEWIQFINIHTQRHIHQLQNIQSYLLRA